MTGGSCIYPHKGKESCLRVKLQAQEGDREVGGVFGSMFLSSLAVAGLKDSPSLSDKRKVGRENLSRAHWSLLPFPDLRASCCGSVSTLELCTSFYCHSCCLL